MDGDDYEIVAFDSTFEEMGKIAVSEMSLGEGIFIVEGHEHDDGSGCDPLEGRTYSILATTFDGEKHELMFSPIQARIMLADLVRFITGKDISDATST